MINSKAFDFQGKSAIVTGAGRGIGRAIAKALDDAGATVYAITRNPKNLETLKAECPKIHTLACDLSNWDETRRVVEAIPPVDCLVNNAAVIHPATFMKSQRHELEAMYKTNLEAVLNVSQIVATKMIEAQKRGAIVNISSVAGLRPMPNCSGYSVLKAALDQMTQVMAQELGPKNIRVNSLNPGPVMTDMLITAVTAWSEETGEDTMEMLKIRTPFTQHVIEMPEITNSVLFLLSDAAPMVHGALVPIDGGLHCM